jgi:hypothetical protein
MARSKAGLTLLIVSVVVASSVHVFAQGTPLTQGPLTVTIPPGWTAQSPGMGPLKYYSQDSTPQQYLTLQFLPAEQTRWKCASATLRSWETWPASCGPARRRKTE